MRKKTFVFALVALISTFVLTTYVNPVQAAIESRSWIGAAYSGTDTFYGVSYTIYAYEEGSTAILVVTVENDYREAGVGKPINVSAVKVGLDWGINYTSTQVSMGNPVVMEVDEIRTFIVSFIVPNTTIASNQFLHGYKIYVEHINSTIGPKKIVDTMTISFIDPTHPTRRPDFAVYSTDQADARETKEILTGMPVPTFVSSRAKLLQYKARNETNTGDMSYKRGDFATAKMHYNTALSMFNSAYIAEETYGVTMEDLTINSTMVDIKVAEASIKYYESWASMVSSLGMMFSLFGVATVFFSIGYVIKQLATLRKSAPETTTK